MSTLPRGRIEVRAARPGGSIEAFFGKPACRSSRVLSLEALRQAWAIAVPLPVLCELVRVLRRAEERAQAWG